MRRCVIAGNWKMNGSRATIQALLEDIKKGRQGVKAELMVFPPYVYLQQVAESLQNSAIGLGAQNMHAQPSGAFTGEISAQMLTDLGCEYVLLGHSERRALFGETNAIIAKKYTAALEAGLTPIVCVGETLEERKAGITHQIINAQLGAILASLTDTSRLKQTIIAYEPVWAIGTGLAAQPEDAQEVHASIRQQVAQYDKDIAEQLRILYGGSVKRDNAAALFAMPDIDGGLIGGASLNAQEFLEIAKLCNN